MSATCPHGHRSSTTDYCDQCGAPMTTEEDPGADTAAAGSSSRAQADAARRASGEPCPGCGTPRAGDDRFCEDCGYDFSTATSHADASAPPAAVWELVVSADRAYFEQMNAEGVEFPADYPPRKFALDRDRMRLGRVRAEPGDAPEINLSGAPEDPAISHLQALLVRQEDGSYAVIDPGSTNGLTLNDDPDPIAAHVPVALADGDRLRLGAWTKVTVRAPVVAPAGAE